MENTRTATAIEVKAALDNTKEYLVMVAHAGRSANTGAKVHMATLTVYADGRRSRLSAANCSNNGHLRGTLITQDNFDFSRVTCKNCGGGNSDAAAARNAKAIRVAA